MKKPKITSKTIQNQSFDALRIALKNPLVASVLDLDSLLLAALDRIEETNKIEDHVLMLSDSLAVQIQTLIHLENCSGCEKCKAEPIQKKAYKDRQAKCAAEKKLSQAKYAFDAVKPVFEELVKFWWVEWDKPRRQKEDPLDDMTGRKYQEMLARFNHRKNWYE